MGHHVNQEDLRKCGNRKREYGKWWRYLWGGKEKRMLFIENINIPMSSQSGEKRKTNNQTYTFEEALNYFVMTIRRIICMHTGYFSVGEGAGPLLPEKSLYYLRKLPHFCRIPRLQPQPHHPALVHKWLSVWLKKSWSAYTKQLYVRLFFHAVFSVTTCTFLCVCPIHFSPLQWPLHYTPPKLNILLLQIIFVPLQGPRRLSVTTVL